ncbi:MAG: calcium-binding EGF-like domain-containing protein [Taibaiella sp.]|nr:calcium-binding EGF-like domain-containing protein [Taibaiella sp.]
MKSILKSTLFAAAVFAGAGLTSCQPDKCETMLACANNGVCNSDGSCTCPLGYEGPRCETTSRDKFKGSWNVIEDGSISNAMNYTVSVQDGVEIDQVIIRNFNNFSNGTVYAKVLLDTVVIPNQQMEQDGELKTVEGKGYFVFEEIYGLHGKLVLKYRVIDKDGIVNDYGYRGAGNPSEWLK